MENQDINQKLDEINKKLDEILFIQKNIHTSSIKMDNHISFIDNVYETVKNPLHFLLNKISVIGNMPTNKTIKE
jgi:hypothetical protein